MDKNERAMVDKQQSMPMFDVRCRCSMIDGHNRRRCLMVDVGVR